MYELKIQFPPDFEKRYDEYKTKILGAQRPARPNLPADFSAARKAQLEALKRSLAKGEEEKKIKNEIIEELGFKEKEIQPTPLPKFRFNQGVLFRDFCNDILMVKGENTKEYRLLDTVVALPARERIDALTENIEMEWRQLYDTARRLNNKIKDIFKIDNFFQIDFQNKKLHRTVE